MSEFLVVTGMSGAGRSTVGATLEDLGWFVIDNLPAVLITKMAEMVELPGSEIQRVALVIGRGGGSGAENLDDLPEVLDSLRASRSRVRVLFLDAPDEVLVRRYEGTRRRHPLAARGVETSITDERQLLEPVRALADIMIDTGELNVNQLRSRVLETFSEEGGEAHMQTSVVSFGYKHGLPLDVDLVFDCRFLPNPYWVEALRPFSGLDAPVRDYVLGQPETTAFLLKVEELLVMLMPAFVREGKSYLTVAMGCTGGRHRSVALAEALGAALEKNEIATSVFHRDIDR
jgi:RNase adapter protein RapZ